MIAPARTGSAIDGAIIAFVVGCLAVVVGPGDILPGLLDTPVVAGIGLATATLLGAVFAVGCVRAGRPLAFALSIVYGVLVAAIVAAIVVLPLAPIAVLFSFIAWPVTLPSAVAWLALVRWSARPGRARTTTSLAIAAVLATVLVGLHFTQPTVSSTAAGTCIAFPGERIERLAWSPGGDWLGLASARGYEEGIIRLIDQQTGRITELARGPNIDPQSGIAVGPGGETTYVVDAHGASAPAEAEATAAWVASPGSAPRRLSVLPTTGVSDLTWTPDGVAAVRWVDSDRWTETHRLVWLRPDTESTGPLEPIDPATIERHPALGPLAEPEPTELVVRVGQEVRRLPWPGDASSEVSVSPDGEYLVFQARRLDDAADFKLYDHLVAQSTATGDRITVAESESLGGRLSSRGVAYLTYDNRACVTNGPPR